MNDRRCPACGSVLPENRLSGLCPACTWKEISDDGGGGVGPTTAGIGDSLMHVRGYEVISEIARGGMGIVYRARQLDPPRVVALKMLLPHQSGSAEMAERFRLEVRALTELEHPAILPVYQVGEHDRLPFFTMKLATGGTLAQRKAEFAGQWRTIAELVATLADAIQFAHEHGVLHRDLKPGNILFDEQGRAYVSDFGLAKLVSAESDLTHSMDFLGTPHYVAPEIAQSSVQRATTASDIYGLGAILYELLADRPPFDAEGIPALLRKIADEPPPKLGATVPRDLEIICLKCLSKQPAARYPSARELAADLRRWLDGRTILARAATPVERLRVWARRNPAWAAAGASLMLALALGVVLEMRANQRLQRALSQSLLSQAQLRRSSGRAGQRFETLTLIERASQYKATGRDIDSQRTVAALRSEVAAALALPDARPLARWPVHISNFLNEFDFTPSLDRYATATPGGGLAVFSTVTHQPIWQRDGISNNAAVELRLSADGRWLAAHFQDGSAVVHDTFTNTPPHRFENGAPFVFAFDARAKQFAIASRNTNFSHDVRVLDLPGGAATRVIVQDTSAFELAFDAAGARLAIASDNLSVWRLSDTNMLWSSPLSHQPSALAWSPDGQRLAVAVDRRTPHKGGGLLKADSVLIFDATTGGQESVFTEASARVEGLAFHPDGLSLAAAGWSGDLVWGSIEPGGFRVVAEGMQRALVFGSDGKRLGYAPTKDELGLLEIAAPTVLREWQTASAPAQETCSMAMSSDGQWLITGTSSAVQLWDATRRREVSSLPLPARQWWVSVLFGADDQFVYYSGAGFGVQRVELVRTNTAEGTRLYFGRSQSIGEPRDFLATGFADDGRSLIVGQNRHRWYNDRIPPTIWLWPEGDPSRGRKLIEDFPLVGYRVIPGGRWGVSTDLIEPDLWVWNAATGERVRSLGIPLPTTSEPAPNGRWLITRTRAEMVVWEVGSWRALARWPVTAEEQASGWLVVSPDSRLLATATGGGRLTLRTMPFGHELITLSPPRPLLFSDWKFSPDHQRLCLLGATGRVFDWDLGALRRELAKLDLDW